MDRHSRKVRTSPQALALASLLTAMGLVDTAAHGIADGWTALRILIILAYLSLGAVIVFFWRRSGSHSKTDSSRTPRADEHTPTH